VRRSRRAVGGARPNDRQASSVAEMNSAAASPGGRSSGQASATRQGRTASGGSSSTTAVSARVGSIENRGTTATPTPAATSPWIVASRSDRNTKVGRSPSYKLLDQANRQIGPARYKAYGDLDVMIAKNYAPWASYDNRNLREFVSKRTGGYLFQPAYAASDLGTFFLK
jgi:hypothetical protein